MKLYSLSFIIALCSAQIMQDTDQSIGQASAGSTADVTANGTMDPNAMTSPVFDPATSQFVFVQPSPMFVQSSPMFVQPVSFPSGGGQDFTRNEAFSGLVGINTVGNGAKLIGADVF